MQQPSHKESAIQFLRLATEGKIQEAYDTYISPDFRHHNAYFKSDAASLKKGMEESHILFPHKLLDVRHAVAEGDIVILHSRVRLSEDKPEMALIHIFKFAGDRVVELWDLGQATPEGMVNELGMF